MHLVTSERRPKVGLGAPGHGMGGGGGAGSPGKKPHSPCEQDRHALRTWLVAIKECQRFHIDLDLVPMTKNRYLVLTAILFL